MIVRILSACAFVTLNVFAASSAAQLAENKFLGTVLVSGDFDGDGVSDLVAGLPTASDNSALEAGAVEVRYGARGLQVLKQSTLDILTDVHPFDYNNFGAAVASGDFNLDGFDDLAIGAPGTTINGQAEAGAVHVLRGSINGLSTAAVETWVQDSNGILDVCEPVDHFGAVLAVGNFGEDGADDLAIGVPDESIGTVADAGGVNVIYGKVNVGLQSANNDFFSQNAMNVHDNAEPDDNFGYALVAGNFGYTSHADLAVGVPGESVGSLARAGAVHVFYGASTGLAVSNAQFWTQDSTGVLDSAERLDQFGESLGGGDFDGDGYRDLAVGVPSEKNGNLRSTGAVNVLYGGANGVGTRQQFWDQGSSGLGTPAPDERFGHALTSADFNNDGRAELVVGAPGDTPSGTSANSGSATVIYGGSGGLSKSNSAQVWSQVPAGILDEPEAYENFGAAVCTGDFDGDDTNDLAVGVPGESVLTFHNTGAINIIEGRLNTGLVTDDSKFITQ